MGGPAFFTPCFFPVVFSDLVHESPETLDFSSALHQVRGPIRLFRKSPEQNLQGLLQMLFRDGERREQAHLFPRRAGGDAQDAVFQAFIDDVGCPFGSRCDGNHQPQTFYCRNPGGISESFKDHGGFFFTESRKPSFSRSTMLSAPAQATGFPPKVVP